ncbi:MAG: hypothetical protein JWM97_2422 [Phycisphaerales bacterium]|nr:hypothetical protein [Phycisphaerales bacterium]
MKSRLTLIFAALVVLLAAMVWMVRDRFTGAVVPSMAAGRTVVIRVKPIAEQTTTPTTAPVASAAAPASEGKSSPMVHVDASGAVIYVARAGDTVSQLAVALLGSDSRKHRDAVIAANTSLQSDPDRVLTGQTYSVPSSSVAGDELNADQRPDAASTAPVAAAGAKEDAPAIKPTSADKANDRAAATARGPKLQYTAQRGDTVSGLAAGLLGGDTKANREGIIAGNASLQQDPDHLIAGQNYTIVARNGLAADPDAPKAKAPTTQPDADEAARLGVGRTLRYTALAGDTVSKLAVVLLGSDTPANRDLIVKSNFTLKQDPDHVIAGRTYWIAAPTANPTP